VDRHYGSHVRHYWPEDVSIAHSKLEVRVSVNFPRTCVLVREIYESVHVKILNPS
jgi:hypothetical protein